MWFINMRLYTNALLRSCTTHTDTGPVRHTKVTGGKNLLSSILGRRGWASMHLTVKRTRKCPENNLHNSVILIFAFLLVMELVWRKLLCVKGSKAITRLCCDLGDPGPGTPGSNCFSAWDCLPACFHGSPSRRSFPPPGFFSHSYSVHLPLPRNIWWCLETFWGVTSGRCYWPPVGRSQGDAQHFTMPRMALVAKNYPDQNANHARAENPRSTHSPVQS